MNLFDYIHASDKDTFINITAELLNDERERIVAQKLASKEEVNSLLNYFIKEMRHRVALGRTASSDDLAYFHRQLKSVMLPGDFEKIAGDFYDLSSLPKLKEKSEEDRLVYYAPVKEEPDEESVEEAEEKLEEVMEQDAKDECQCDCGCKVTKVCLCPDCDCPHAEKSDDDDAHDVKVPEEGSGPAGLSLILLNRLEDTAYKLGVEGRHTEAYEVEKVIRGMRESIAKDADIWNEMSQMEKNPPRNTAPQQRMQQQWQARKQQQQRQPAQQRQQVQPQKQQQRQAPRANPQQLQQAAQSIRQKVFQNPKVPRPYKNTGTLMRVLQRIIQRGQAKDVSSAAQLLEKRLARFK